MKDSKLYIVMVGLPARGKSTIANRLKHSLNKDSIPTRIFNNGELRRRLVRVDTSSPNFYNPNNREASVLREKIALINIQNARRFLGGQGRVAILDATNVSLERRKATASLLTDHPILFLECLNNDGEILEASIRKKIMLSEFKNLDPNAAIERFKRRIQHYEGIYVPLRDERSRVRLDSLNNRILEEDVAPEVPFFDRIRDFLVTDWVKSLFLIRHGETTFNLENRIGGDSGLTERGWAQASAMALYFQSKDIPCIFTSRKQRTIQTAQCIQKLQKACEVVPLDEFDEIDSGTCECMTYEEIRVKMPHVYGERKKDKFNYIYPEGEGYATMKERIDRGIKKALFLSGNSDNVMIVGHRAANRMILAHFLYRRQEDVAYTYIPQDKFYHIVATQDKKLFQLKKYGLLNHAKPF